jgi:hypothetical protein
VLQKLNAGMLLSTLASLDEKCDLAFYYRIDHEPIRIDSNLILESLGKYKKLSLTINCNSVSSPYIDIETRRQIINMISGFSEINSACLIQNQKGQDRILDLVVLLKVRVCSNLLLAAFARIIAASDLPFDNRQYRYPQLRAGSTIRISKISWNRQQIN